MSLPKSSLSQVCRAISDFVSDGIGATTHSTRVMIGNPSAAVPAQTDDEHRVNLFFYRIEPAGLFTGDTPGDPWWVRLQCLVTGFGVPEDQVSAGENDLRLLGEVMRVFHETPLLPSLKVDDEEFRMQVVFQPLSIDDLNHIWSTQSGVSYRPSVAYEMALAPVIPSERRPDSPLVGSVGSELRADRAGRTAAFTGEPAAPPVRRSTVDTSDPAWAPAICFVIDGHCAQSLAFQAGSTALANFKPQVWVAGAPGASIDLAWQVWASSQGWHDVAGTTATKAGTVTLDPESAATAGTQVAPLPAGFADTPGQAVLYAERRCLRGLDGLEITVKSNPLLITVYGAS